MSLLNWNIEDLKNPRAQVYFKKQNSKLWELNPANLNVWILLFSSETQKKQLIKNLEAKGLFKKFLQTLFSSPANQKVTKVEQGLSQGGKLKLFLVDQSTTTFERHEELRKFLAKDFEACQNDRIHVGIAGNLRDESNYLDAVSYLYFCSFWKAHKFTSKDKNNKLVENTFHFYFSSLAPAGAKKVFEKSSILAEANALTRTLAELPPNVLNPEKYVSLVKELAKKTHLEVEFLGKAELEKREAGAFLAVGQADPLFKGGILQLKNFKNGKADLILVGKGLCFDTGGYNIKTGTHMFTMHKDMTGSALALSAILFLKRLRPKLKIEAHLAISENLISSTAFKPNDIVKTSEGSTIEVVDTDAEGRMVLSDTLAMAAKKAPQLIVDFATLTGACVRAIGTRRSGVFSNQLKLAQKAVEAGIESGERVWNFPIGEDYLEDLKSQSADLLQCAHVLNCDHIYAATLLSQFVGHVPWVHIDLSAEENKGGLGLVSSDTTGFGIRWLEAFIEKVL